MNALEMHIEVNLSLQKIKSNYYRNLLDSEIDWILNKHVDRFVKDRIRQDSDSLGFDATEIDLDALRTLVVLDRDLPTFQIESDATRAELPGDYAYLIDDFSYTVPSTDLANFAAANQFVNTPVYMYAYPLIASVSSTPYQNISFKLASNFIFNSSGLTGLQTAAETFTIRDYILNQLWTNRPVGVDFYWERCMGIYMPNTIIAVSNTAQVGTNTITIDGVVTNATSSSFNQNYVPALSAGTLVNNRLVRGHYRSNLRMSVFAQAATESPISAVSGNQIKVYHDGKFIVTKLRVSYVRKPAKINLYLNQNCDLADTFHQQICDMSVLYMKELITAPDWEVKLKDRMLNKD